MQSGIGELDGRRTRPREDPPGGAGLAGLDECAAAIGGVLNMEEGLALTQACQTLARAARDSVVFAFDHAGTSVVYARSPLQRCLRDIFAGLKHVAFTPAFMSLIGKHQLGVPAFRTVL